MRTKMNILIAATLLLSTLYGAQTSSAKKPYTITERQATLSKRVVAGEKSGELTQKEATSFKDDLAGITEKETKMKAANGGKLSYADENKLEKELNKVSVAIDKKELAKRVSK